MKSTINNLIHSKLLYLIIILITAFILRIWGIDFGLPYIYHTDEGFEVHRALKLGAGVFEFERIGKGGYFYLLFFEYGIFFVILKLFGVIHSGDQFLYKYFQDPTPFWLIGRITTAVIGTLNCYLLYMLGRYAFSKTVGLFASLFMAIHLLHVASSHCITVDVPLTTLITFCFLIMFWKPAEKFNKGDYILLGIFAALAITTKITGAIIIFPILFFHYKNLKSEFTKVTFKSYFCDSRLLMFLTISTFVYVLANPGIIFTFTDTVKWVISFINPAAAVSEPSYPQLYDKAEAPIRYYLSVLFPVKYLLVSIFVFGGLFVCLKKNYYRTQLFLFFLIPYFLFLFSSKRQEHIYARYILPVMPILWFYAGVLLEYLLKIRVKYKTYCKILIFTILIVSIYPLLKDSIAFNINLTKPDTRTLAKEWVEENIPVKSIIFIEGELIYSSTLTVPLNIMPELVDGIILNKHLQSGEELKVKKNKFYEILKKSLQNKKTYHLVFTNDNDKKQIAEAFDKQIGDYVILRGNAKASFVLDVNRKRFPEFYRLVSWVDSDDFELIKEFEPSRKLSGPKILIYERTQARIQEGTSNNYGTKENSYHSRS